MSSNQSRLDRNESQQYRNSGRSNRNYSGGRGSKATGTGSEGGATAATPSCVISNSNSTDNPALSSNRRAYRRHTMKSSSFNQCSFLQVASCYEFGTSSTMKWYMSATTK